MCPQLPRLSPEYSHKAGLQTVITGMPLQIRPVTRGGHAGPVTMGRITHEPLSWARLHCGMTPSQAFIWCRIERRVSLPVLSLSDQRHQRRPRAKGGVFAFAPTTSPRRSRRSQEKFNSVRLKFTRLSGGALDCPVSQRPPAQRSFVQSAGDAWPAPTVGWGHRTVSGAPTSLELQRSAAPGMEGNRAPNMNSGCPVVHQTVRCATRQKARFASLLVSNGS
jgi:hypothetical protein